MFRRPPKSTRTDTLFPTRRSSDLFDLAVGDQRPVHALDPPALRHVEHVALAEELLRALFAEDGAAVDLGGDVEGNARREVGLDGAGDDRSEEHTSELQSLMRISFAVFCLKQQKKKE